MTLCDGIVIDEREYPADTHQFTELVWQHFRNGPANETNLYLGFLLQKAGQIAGRGLFVPDINNPKVEETRCTT